MNVTLPGTATETTRPVRHESNIPELMGHWAGSHPKMQEKGLPPALSHLIELRVSQINGCAFCIQMHRGEALEAGITDDKLSLLPAWADEVSCR